MNHFINYQSKVWSRVFVSLSEHPIELRDEGKAIWSPRVAGVKFRSVDSSMIPADSAAARLVQMRNIAKEFHVDCHWGGKDKTDWRLRLLTTPVYRYQLLEEGIVDGALFVFVQAGPETALLVEARKTPSAVEWHYAAARCTTYSIRVTRNETTILDVPHLDLFKPDEPFFGLRTPLAEYPFENPFADFKGTSNTAPE